MIMPKAPPVIIPMNRSALKRVRIRSGRRALATLKLCKIVLFPLRAIYVKASSMDEMT